jgi:hypothetical protein
LVKRSVISLIWTLVYDLYSLPIFIFQVMPVLITLVIQSLLMVDFAFFKLNRKPFGKTMEEVDFSLNGNTHDVWLVRGSNWNIINISNSM